MIPKPNLKLITVVLALLPVVLAGCQSTPTLEESPVQTDSLSNVNQMIEQAQGLPSPQSESLLIDAAELLLEQQKLQQAARVLDSINPSNLDAQTRLKLVTTLTHLAIAQDDIAQAQELLTTDRLGILTMSSELSPQELNELSLLRAQVWELSENFLAAARERIFVSPMLEQNAAAENQKKIWLDLIQVPAETLDQLSQSAAIPEIQGWLELAWIYKGLQDNLDEQLQALTRWQQRHPNHPAAVELPESLQLLTELSDKRPTRIALLLPSQGKYKLAAQAILNGFVSAHKVSNKNNSDAFNAISIQVYDSSNTDTFEQTYQQAVNDGAQVIIGPLQKENVRKLAGRPAQLPVTTIALNQASTGFEMPSNLIQFGLSPEEDARQVADFALASNHQRAAVLYQDNPWWERAYGAFAQQWVGNQGEINSTATYKDQTKMANAIQEMLLVQLSQLRAQQLKRITGKKIECQPRRRQDIDFIFLMATPEQARQIRPLLDFYYATDIPVIASSQIYSGKADPKKDKDLNGIQFCDIPWLLEKPDAIQQAMQEAWPNANHRYFRLNAMGVDAYRLASRIELLLNLPDAGLFGATGILSIGPNQEIQRQLTWAVMENGTAKPIPKKAPVPEATPTPFEQGSQNEAAYRKETHREPS